MQSFVRFRAGKLVAGIGVILAGTLSGCWDAQKRPSGPTNFPKGTINTGGAGQPGNNSAAFPGNPNLNNANGAPINRTTGAPPFVENSGRSSVGPASTNMGNPANPLLTPPVNSGPIATNGGATRNGIQPANFGPAPGASGRPGEPMPLPLKDTDANASSIPSVPPISTQGQDPKTRYYRSSPPPIPDDALNPTISLPSKSGTLPPPLP
jgi:hypothetical protein